MIVDYSLARPTVDELRALGVTGVIRYGGWDCQPGFACERKNLTPAELAMLLAAGLDVGLTFEYAANAALNGAPQGAADAGLADLQIGALGMVSTASRVGNFYAVDFDVPDFAPHLPNAPQNARAKLGPIAAYFDAANAVGVDHEVDGYGGYWAVSRLLDAGLVRKAWQTLAWSAGQEPPVGATHAVVEDGVIWDTRAVLRQTGQTRLGDLDVDTLEVAGSDPDWGQWPRPGQPKPPIPGTWEETVVKAIPTLRRGASGAYVRRVQGLAVADGHGVTVDGQFGAQTEAAVRAVQSSSGVAVDGVVGPETWAALLTGAGL